MFKSGFIAIVGRPNVGKSTFLNFILGQKISIISQKPQTTRNTIQGIYTTKEAQMIFIDTPGIHKPIHELGNYMNQTAIHTLKDVDLILWMMDVTAPFGKGDEYILQLLSKLNTPVFLMANKMDLVKDKTKMKENIDKFTIQKKFSEIVYLSALEGTNVHHVLELILNYLPEGPTYYPENQITDHPESFIIGEMIREKILLLTKEEVPHSIAVVVDEMKQDENQLMNIRATIYVERKSQKKIIIGSHGNMIKAIGTQARKDIVMLLGQKVYLDLWVKVEEDWRDKKNILHRLGYYLENH